MDYKVIGFFVGAAPSMAYWLWRGMNLRRVGKVVEQVAAREGRIFSTDYSYSDQWRLILKPRSIIDAGDSQDLVSAKEALIKQRGNLVLAMFLCSLTAFVGGIAGVFLGTLISQR